MSVHIQCTRVYILDIQINTDHVADNDDRWGIDREGEECDEECVLVRRRTYQTLIMHCSRYSNFHVGAALLTVSGEIVTGGENDTHTCNIYSEQWECIVWWNHMCRTNSNVYCIIEGTPTVCSHCCRHCTRWSGITLWTLSSIPYRIREHPSRTTREIRGAKYIAF